MSNVFNPTLVFGVGRLGCEAVSRLRDELPGHGKSPSSNSVLVALELADPEALAESLEITARVQKAGEAHVHSLGGSSGEKTGLKNFSLSTDWNDERANDLALFTCEHAKHLLRLDHFLDYSEAGRLLPPRFSVFVVADLGEEEVRKVINPLIETVGRTLLSRFSHIFNPRGPEGEPANLGIYPVLMLGGVRDGSTPHRHEITEVLAELTGLVRDSKNWWNAAGARLDALRPCISRTVLLDDQTTKYVLDRSEIISSILGFLSVAMFSGDSPDDARDEESWALSNFLQGSEEDWNSSAVREDEPPVFATFGVATLDVSQEVVTGYVENRLALYILERMRPANPDDSKVMTLRHLWAPAEIEARLKGYGAGESAAEADGAVHRSVGDMIEKRLRDLSDNLKNLCEPVEPSDSPERILNSKYSWPWFEELAGRYKRVCKELEMRDLPRAGDEVDRRGLALGGERMNELKRQVDEWVWSEPAGWNRAKQHLQELRVELQRESANFELEPNLPNLPDTEPVRRAVMEVRNTARTWPRRWRVVFSAFFAAFLLTAVFHFMPKWLYVRFAYQNDVYIPAGEVGDDAAQVSSIPDPRYDPPGWLENPMLFELPPHQTAARLVLNRPYVFIWLYLLFLFFMWLYFRRYLKKRREEMERSIRFLKNRIEELVIGMSNSVRDYFGKRVKFSRDLWIHRLMQRIEDQAGEEIDRLNVVDTALRQLVHKYREAQKRLGVRYTGRNDEVEDLSGVRTALGDAVYRRLLDADTLVEIYQDTVGEEVNRLKDFYDELNVGGPGRDAGYPEWRDNPPFVDEDVLEGFLKRVTLEAGSDLNVLERLLRDQDDRPVERLKDAVKLFFSQLTGKLSHSVEMRAPAGARSITRLLLLPYNRLENFGELFAKMLQEAGLQQALGLRMQRIGSRDTERVHLFVGYSGLRLSDFRWLSNTGSGMVKKHGKLPPRLNKSDPSVEGDSE